MNDAALVPVSDGSNFVPSPVGKGPSHLG